jgi:hypothetical protein
MANMYKTPIEFSDFKLISYNVILGNRIKSSEKQAQSVLFHIYKLSYNEKIVIIVGGFEPLPEWRLSPANPISF